MQLSGEKACAKDEEADPELFVVECLVQRGGGEVHQRRSDLPVRRLVIDANDSLLELTARIETDGDSGGTEYLTAFNVPEQPVLAHIRDDLGNDVFADAPQTAVLEREAAAADRGDHEIKERERPPADEV